MFEITLDSRNHKLRVNLWGDFDRKYNIYFLGETDVKISA